jgi:hypothetical protein
MNFKKLFSNRKFILFLVLLLVLIFVLDYVFKWSGLFNENFEPIQNPKEIKETFSECPFNIDKTYTSSKGEFKINDGCSFSIKDLLDAPLSLTWNHDLDIFQADVQQGTETGYKYNGESQDLKYWNGRISGNTMATNIALKEEPTNDAPNQSTSDAPTVNENPTSTSTMAVIGDSLPRARAEQRYLGEAPTVNENPTSTSTRAVIVDSNSPVYAPNQSTSDAPTVKENPTSTSTTAVIGDYNSPVYAPNQNYGSGTTTTGTPFTKTYIKLTFTDLKFEDLSDTDKEALEDSIKKKLKEYDTNIQNISIKLSSGSVVADVTVETQNPQTLDNMNTNTNTNDKTTLQNDIIADFYNNIDIDFPCDRCHTTDTIIDNMYKPREKNFKDNLKLYNQKIRAAKFCRNNLNTGGDKTYARHSTCRIEVMNKFKNFKSLKKSDGTEICKLLDDESEEETECKNFIKQPKNSNSSKKRNINDKIRMYYDIKKECEESSTTSAGPARPAITSEQCKILEGIKYVLNHGTEDFKTDNIETYQGTAGTTGSPNVAIKLVLGEDLKKEIASYLEKINKENSNSCSADSLLKNNYL